MNKDHREAMWELYWMVMYGQSRLVTFKNIQRYGFSKREAALYLIDFEKDYYREN